MQKNCYGRELKVRSLTRNCFVLLSLCSSDFGTHLMQGGVDLALVNNCFGAVTFELGLWCCTCGWFIL